MRPTDESGREQSRVAARDLGSTLPDLGVAILDAFSTAAAIVDAAGTLLHVNPAWSALARGTPSDPAPSTGMAWHYLPTCGAHEAPDTVHALSAGLREVLDGVRAGFTLEYTCHSDEEQQWFRAQVTPLACGDATLALLTHQCLGRQKRSERALQERHEKLLRVARTVPGFLGCLNAETLRYEFTNEMYERAFGLPADRIVGMHVRALLGEASYETARPYLEAAMAGQCASYENAFNLPPGTRWFLVSFTPIRDANGDVKHIAVFSIDITARKEAELALKESEERYRRLFEVAPEGILVADEQGVLVDANATMCSLAGREREQLVGVQIGDIVVEPEIPCDQPASVSLRTMQDHEPGCILRRGDGTTFLAEVKAGSIPNDRTLALVRDVTERRRMEARLHHSEKMMAIGQLAGGVAHDFNNLLTGILGYSDMLAGRLEDETQDRFARRIRSAAMRAADLTKQLLAFSRKGKFLSAPVDVHKVIGEVVALLEHSIDKQIEIRQLLEARQHRVLGDLTQIQNALINLAINARDAMPDGGTLTFRTSVVELAADPAEPEVRAGRYLQVCVSDTGTGMDAETLGHVFEPFFTTKEQGKGTGLGLAAVHGVVKNHRGTISVQSTPETGTTFRACLPLLEEAEPEETPSSVLPPRQGEANLLVVDDEAFVRELATDQLSSLGYRVTTCCDGEEAVAYYRGAWEEVDLVVLDMIMPRMGGRETFLALRRINPRVRILLVSGHSLDGEAQRILDEGGLGFVQKPFDRTQLARAVGKALMVTPPSPAPG